MSAHEFVILGALIGMTVGFPLGYFCGKHDWITDSSQESNVRQASH